MKTASHSRRTFLRHATTSALASQFPAFLHGAASAEEPEAAVERAHAELWRRFVDEHGIILDETALDGGYERPTPEECRLGKPNAVGWLTPIANGAMFTGLYLDAAILRALHTEEEADRAKARRLAGGLLLLSEIGEVKGFIARGPATDGRTTYALGSNDQTMPWFYGLWRYLRSGLAEGALRRRILAKLIEVAEVFESTSWKMPAAPPFGFRGSFANPGWDGAPRLLFLMKAMHTLTGDARWARHYERSLYEIEDARKKGGQQSTPLQACEAGVASRPKPRMWTGSVSNACLRELWELERDATVRASFARGLTASAEFAAANKLLLAREFDNDSGKIYDGDWRKLNHLWRPQQTSAEASEVSEPQRTLKNRNSPRAGEEGALVRESAFAAWIITLCPDREIVAQQRDAIFDVITHYRYDRLNLSTFFPLESAWWRLTTT